MIICHEANSLRLLRTCPTRELRFTTRFLYCPAWPRIRTPPPPDIARSKDDAVMVIIAMTSYRQFLHVELGTCHIARLRLVIPFELLNLVKNLSSNLMTWFSASNVSNPLRCCNRGWGWRKDRWKIQWSSRHCRDDSKSLEFSRVKLAQIVNIRLTAQTFFSYSFVLQTSITFYQTTSETNDVISNGFQGTVRMFKFENTAINQTMKFSRLEKKNTRVAIWLHISTVSLQSSASYRYKKNFNNSEYIKTNA